MRFTLLFFIFLLSVGITVQSKTAVIQDIGIDTEISNVNLTNDTFDTNLAKDVKSFVVFADNFIEYEKLKTQAVSSYDNLQAVVIEITADEYKSYDHIYEYSKFSNSFVKFDSRSQLDLDNGYDDADIIGITKMWNLGYNGTGVNVAVYDNGISSGHPGLQGQVVLSYSVAPKEFSPCRDHGTPVAGNIAATGMQKNGEYDPNLRGMAFGAKLVDLSLGCGDGLSIEGDFLGGFDWLLENNASIDVINASWGGYGLDFIPDEIIRKLADVNVIFVTSAGNSGPEPYTIYSPSNVADSITVGAINYLEGITSFSSHGPAPGMIFKPDVLAPGSNVISTQLGGEYGPISGTSFSSPLTAGAIATILSALKANNVKYNPGLIKATLMNNATSIELDENIQGKGIVNAYDSYMNIMNQKNSGNVGADGIPYAFDISPRIGSQPNSIFKDVFSDIKMEIPFTLISSHPLETDISITGDLTDIMSFDNSDIISSYSQNLGLKIDTNGKSGSFSGNMIIELGSSKITVPYTINIKGIPEIKVLMDLRHTAWDEVGGTTYAGYFTAEFMEMAYKRSVWFEEYHDILETSVLKNYDVLWMPNPLEIELNYNNLLDSEITAIVNYVNTGGSFFTDFSGRVDYSWGNTGVDVSINNLLSNFGITAKSTPVYEPIIEYADLLNYSSLSGSVKYVSHEGNYLEVSGEARAVAITDNGNITIAMNDVIDGGRVLVSSSSFLSNEQIADEGNDYLFANNLLDWLSSSTQVKYVSETLDNNKFIAEFQILENGVVPTIVPEVKLIGNDFVDAKSITPVKNGNTWKFEFDATEDGVYSFIVGDENYIKWSMSVDNDAPKIIPTEKNPNQSVFKRSSSLFLFFDVEEAVTQFNKQDFVFQLDGDAILEEELKINFKESKLILLFNDADNTFFEDDDHIYNLIIELTDDAGHLGQVIYEFAFSDVFTSINSSSTSDSGTDTTESPFYFPFLTVFTFLFILSRNYHNKRK